MKKIIYVLAVTLVIATLVISSTATIPITRDTAETDNSVSDYEITVAPKNGDNFIQSIFIIIFVLAIGHFGQHHTSIHYSVYPILTRTIRPGII